MRALALVLVLALVVVAREAGGDVTGRFATMALGFVLIVAPLVGQFLERFGLPRLTGYLLVGLLSGPSMFDLITPAMADQLRLVNGLAVALIAFGAGMELDLPRLVRERVSLWRHGGVLIGLLFAGLLAAALVASQWLPFTAGEAWPRRVAISLVLASVMTTFSPTVVMAVLAETRARGPLTDRVLALVVVGDLGIILLFTLASTGARLLDGGEATIVRAFGHVTWELLGSVVIGAVAGGGIAFYRRLVDRRSGLVVAAVCLVLAELGSRMGLSGLLTCLVAGLVVRSAAPKAAHEMEVLLARVRLPVLIVFFAAAGASLHLAQMWVLGPIVLGLALVRVLLIFGANRLGAKVAGLDPTVARHVPFGLISQAGVTMGLAVLVGREFGAWGRTLETVVVATIALQQLVGPVAFRWALSRLGEIPSDPEASEVTPGAEPLSDPPRPG